MRYKILSVFSLIWQFYHQILTQIMATLTVSRGNYATFLLRFVTMWVIHTPFRLKND
ncbi:hypothetical protein SAMN04488511_1238 [Pedobacter suwonensis]|uniref:Uncharacterized protein n=1 Tax=Pedobacter suwonensis TaxID=332999 RepID=A0A1I0U6I8_9SPHI|nr:hypothetical protein SAMN04488511_1238 [Pedobacter suwonensis]